MSAGALKNILLTTLLTLAIFCRIPAAFAQQDTEEDLEIKGVESELEKNIPMRTEPSANRNVVIKKNQDVLKIDNLATEKAQSQIVVIQKNYMPKTSRFDISGGVTLFPSDVFFKTYGIQPRFSYFFSETWGAELSAILLFSAKSKELQDLENKQGVTANNLATLNSFYGANIYFSNMFGKYAMNDRKIFPFEIYQTVGLGQVRTDKSISPAVTAGAGQLVSLSQNSALRFDLSLLFYQTETISGDKQQSTSLLVTLAFDSLFPGVAKRW